MSRLRREAPAPANREGLRARILQLLPPLLLNPLRARFGSIRFSGDYESFRAALADCTGYDDGDILARVERAALAVQRGHAAFERDGVLFDEVQLSWPVLASLLWIATESDGRLHVLDFGGSLGSSYQQNRQFLGALRSLCWSVVEQPHFVARGRSDFEDEVLRFYPDVASCIEANRPNVLLLSSVLQYLEDPYSALEALLAHEIEFVLVDRTPMLDGGRDRLCIQRVAAHMGQASYPAWFFSRTKFLRQFSGRYRLVQGFDGDDRANIPSRFQGFLFQRSERSRDAG